MANVHNRVISTHAISRRTSWTGPGYDWDDDDDDDADDGHDERTPAPHSAAGAVDARLIPADDAVMIDIEYVRPIRERHDAIRALGFAWETAGLRDGSGVAVVCEVSGPGICTPQYAEATAAGPRPQADVPPPGVERGDVILRLNKVVLSEEDAALLPALLSKAAELDRLTLRVLRARPGAIERVIEHGLTAAVSARVDAVLCAELVPASERDATAAAAAAAAAADPTSHARDPPMPFVSALADAVGLGPLPSSPDVAMWARGRSFERARAHALLSRELVYKFNDVRKEESSKSASGGLGDEQHPSTDVWLALAAFGAGASDASELCRAALGTEAGSRRRRELLPALSRALATRGDTSGATEQLWVEAAAAEAEGDHGAVLRCLFDVAVMADHAATNSTGGGGLVAALTPLPPGVADTYRRAISAGAQCESGTLSVAQRRWMAAAATRVGAPVPEGCNSDGEGGVCVIA
jgi:hypothetical protein